MLRTDPNTNIFHCWMQQETHSCSVPATENEITSILVELQMIWNQTFLFLIPYLPNGKGFYWPLPILLVYGVCPMFSELCCVWFIWSIIIYDYLLYGKMVSSFVQTTKKNARYLMYYQNFFQNWRKSVKLGQDTRHNRHQSPHWLAISLPTLIIF